MSSSMLNTFNTQRYDPQLRRQVCVSLVSTAEQSSNSPFLQRSCISGSYATSITPSTSTHASLSAPGPSTPIKEPSPADGHSPSRARSTCSSLYPSSCRWHEGHCGRVSTLAITDIFDGDTSHSTSQTSFHLSNESTERSMLKAEGIEIDEGRRQLAESLLSAAQVEAHIPTSPLSIDSSEGIRTETDEEDEGDDIQGQVRLVPPRAAAVVGARRVHDDPLLTIRNPDYGPRTARSSPSLSSRYSQEHPEYDSNSDSYPNSATSSLSSPSYASISSGHSENEDDDDPRSVDLGNAVISINPPGSTANMARPHLVVLSPSSTPSIYPSTRFRSPSAMHIARLSGVSEEEIQIIRVTNTIRPATSLNSLNSNQPIRQSPHRDTPPTSTTAGASAAPTSPTVDGNSKVWWRIFSKHQCRVSGRGSAENPRSISCDIGIDVAQTSAAHIEGRPIPSGSSQPSPVVHATSDAQQRESRPLPPLPRLPPTALATQATCHKRIRTKSGTRKVLSAIFPCIPVSPEDKEKNEETYEEQEGHGSGCLPKNSSRVAGTRTVSVGRKLAKSRQGESGDGDEMKGKPSGTLLEVRVERQVSRVVHD
ncbi:hypothetical protein P691DRAFT_225150 [Macrolepiota fuliginosa MF-IS2]|uniref:Uncharacterized protein n=1 Tax=Macrolepiota fuliginosa MF-IS2 TaxID=1400762 RepID=A0A9P6C299_9AGAR|nr:hypothetical protein P691DRAFT_225150 [Macrolepiota fuliginosa MF-IS2]